MDIKIATAIDEVARLIILRYKVFVLEQGFAEELEVDEHDAVATFLVPKERQKVVGTLRLFILRKRRMSAERQKKEYVFCRMKT